MTHVDPTTRTTPGRWNRLIHPIGVSSSRWERLAIAIAAGSMGTLGFSITSPLLPDLAEALSVDAGAIGLVQAAVSVPGVLLSLLIGYFADKVGRRRVVLVSLVLFSLAGAAGYLARSFSLLVAARLIQGIGTSGILGLSIVLVGDLFQGKERTRAMGFNMAGLTAVNMAGPTLSGIVGRTDVFRPFLIFLIGIPLAMWVTRMPVEPARQAESPLRHLGAAFRFVRRAGRVTDYVGILGATVATTVLLHGFGYTTTPLYLDEVFGIESSGRGLIIAAFQVGTVIAAVQIGRLRARRSASSLVSLSLGLMAAGAIATAAAPTWWFVAVGLGVSGIGFGLWVPIAQEHTAEVGGDVYRGLTVLMWVTFVRVAQVIGPPMGASMSESIGPRTTFLIAGVGMGLAMLAWRPVRTAATRRFETAVREAP
ncbi:MAG: MFS transporter [Acidimicrobiia bacterium]|nr:MFS transporter [Acidimicrobiia bacterium]